MRRIEDKKSAVFKRKHLIDEKTKEYVGDLPSCIWSLTIRVRDLGVYESEITIEPDKTTDLLVFRKELH